MVLLNVPANENAKNALKIWHRFYADILKCVSYQTCKGIFAGS